MKTRRSNGQALVTLLFFVLIAVTITSASIVVIMVNTKASSSFQEGNAALYIAESGIEAAIINLLRNPAYPGETMSFADGNAEVTVSGQGSVIISSKGNLNGKSRTVSVSASYSDESLKILSWKEM